MRKHLILVLGICLLLSCEKEKKTQVENNSSLYFGGDIITMAGQEPDYAEALVVEDGKISYIGSNQEAMKVAGQGFKSIDLKGKTLLPGFIDGHSHFANFSAQAIGAQLLPPPDAGAKDIPSIINLLKEWDTPENRALTGWIFGTGFDDSVIEESAFLLNTIWIK